MLKRKWSNCKLIIYINKRFEGFHRGASSEKALRGKGWTSTRVHEILKLITAARTFNKPTLTVNVLHLLYVFLLLIASMVRRAARNWRLSGLRARARARLFLPAPNRRIVSKCWIKFANYSQGSRRIYDLFVARESRTFFVRNIAPRNFLRFYLDVCFDSRIIPRKGIPFIAKDFTICSMMLERWNNAYSK